MTNFHMKSEWFDCVCHSMDHAIRVSYMEDEDDIRCHELYIDTQFPRQKNLWERLVLAVRYVFGMDMQHNTYGEAVLDVVSVNRLRRFLNEFDALTYQLQKDVPMSGIKPGELNIMAASEGTGKSIYNVVETINQGG
jgi:hypothetical protein